MTVNVERSRVLSKLFKSKNGECYTNSIQVVLQAFGPRTRGLRYVEGFAISHHGLVVQHGWVEAKGEILEVTPVWLEGESKCRYFPGRRYMRSELTRKLAKAGDTYFPLCDIHWYRQEPMRQAYKAAYLAMLGEEGFAKLQALSAQCGAGLFDKEAA